MQREHLLTTIKNYHYFSEKEVVKNFEDFIQRNPDCFQRSNLKGHITGSAFIVSSDWKNILLCKHAKIKKWLQLGGHADGEPLAYLVALKEAKEESGIENLKFYTHFGNDPFLLDLDIHEIPTYKDVPAHLHFDVRYLLITNEKKTICSKESIELKWIPLDEIEKNSNEPSILRATKKILNLKNISYKI